jgi:D-alanyl-D-alanine carboxypeptidase (penicillin-binding protein 5/6)
MKFFASATLMFLLSLTLQVNAKAEKLALSVSGEAAIIMNADTGAIIFEKNAHQLHYPASTTKIATALYALQKVADKMDVQIAADQDCIGTVKEEAIRKSNYTMAPHLLIPDGSHIGIKRGEILSLRDLFYGMMVASGDDAANVIAKYAGGTIPLFMQGMNDYVKLLGCLSTTFYNPHGLHHPKQQTTAYDLAILTKEALKNPLFCEMVSTVRYTRPKTNKQEPSTLVQTNRLLRNGPFFYSKAIGVKTGYYSLAGNNLVAAAKDGDRTLITVLLKVKDRKELFSDTKKMFEAAFSQPKVQRVLLHQGVQKFNLELLAASKAITSYIQEDITIEYYPAEEPTIKCVLMWDKNIELPISKGEKIGDIVLEIENQKNVHKVPLYAAERVEKKWLYKFKSFFSVIVWMKILGVLLAIYLIVLFIKKLRDFK